MGVRGVAAAAGAIAASDPTDPTALLAPPLKAAGSAGSAAERTRDALFERLANGAGLSARGSELMADRGTSECPLLRRVMADVYGGRVVPVTAALIAVGTGRAPDPVAFRASWFAAPTRRKGCTDASPCGGPICVTPRLIHLPAVAVECADYVDAWGSSRRCRGPCALEVPALAPLAVSVQTQPLVAAGPLVSSPSSRA